MIFQAISSIGSFVTREYVKQYFCIQALDAVRTELQHIITQVASHHIALFAATIIGSQLGIAFALPVTLFLGDCVALAADITIQAIIRLALAYFKGYNSDQKIHVKDLIFHIASYVSGFFAKTYFCNFGMPYVQQGIEWASKNILQIWVSPIIARIFSWNISLLSTFNATLILGSMWGSLVDWIALKTFYVIDERGMGNNHP